MSINPSKTSVYLTRMFANRNTITKGKDDISPTAVIFSSNGEQLGRNGVTWEYNGLRIARMYFSSTWRIVVEPNGTTAVDQRIRAILDYYGIASRTNAIAGYKLTAGKWVMFL